MPTLIHGHKPPRPKTMGDGSFPFFPMRRPSIFGRTLFAHFATTMVVQPCRLPPLEPSCCAPILVSVDSHANRYDNVEPMAHHFFSRCLEAGVTPYVVTKKTVFKWQETFWLKMKTVFDAHYRTQVCR